MEWQPIETAPRDGTDVLMYLPNDEPDMAVGYFCGDDDFSFWAFREELVNSVVGEANPTHWMPKPEAPNATEFSRAAQAKNEADAA